MHEYRKVDLQAVLETLPYHSLQYVHIHPFFLLPTESDFSVVI